MSIVINVVNKRKHKPTPHDFYAGRPSPLGNPFSHQTKGTLAQFRVSTREEAVAKHKEYFYEEIKTNEAMRAELLKIKDHIWEHKLVNLVCFCAPASCHCDTIKEYLLKS